ncbi:2,3-diaminopropionate biosynthesis protein SbnA [Lonsdalea quercina]|uniref:2,3-diaminopropionate biosynthesis protein SbnA n=1 Tax=Lonsdalea quercina TaxID=71657 RepID=UPI0039758C8A
MIHPSVIDLIHHDDFLLLPDFSRKFKTHLKIEGFNVGCSIKLKAAKNMLESLEHKGIVRSGAKIIESSSGNLGLALSIICATKNYKFTCVSDPNISPQTARMIKAYGSELVIIKEKDINGGYLGKRLEFINQRLEKEPELIWVNQYRNEDNVLAHYKYTGPEILRNFSKVDYIFIGAGTTGTLGGVSRYAKEVSPQTKIVAIDTVGSVTFGGKGKTRKIPGLGTSKSPYIAKYSIFDDMLMIHEEDTVNMCLQIAKRGLLIGGSTGTVLCGVRQYEQKITDGATVVAISPDLGDRYINTIYNPEWVSENFPSIAI